MPIIRSRDQDNQWLPYTHENVPTLIHSEIDCPESGEQCLVGSDDVTEHLNQHTGRWKH